MGIFYRDDSEYMQENTKKSSRYDDEFMIESGDTIGEESEDSLNLDSFYDEGAHEIGETPSARPYDKSEISVPKSSEIDVTVYNKQLEQLKRTFKESVEIIESIRPEY